MKDNLGVLRAFEELLKDSFPGFPPDFYRQLAMRLGNFAFVWDEFCEDIQRIEQEKQKLVDWIKENH